MTDKRFTVDDGLEDVLCWEINDKENENMTCGECAKLLNELHEENQSFEIHSKWQGEKYSELLDSFTNMKKKLQLVKKENEELKSIKTFAERNGINVFLIEEAFQKCWNDNGKLIKENEQLKNICKNLIHKVNKRGITVTMTDNCKELLE